MAIMIMIIILGVFHCPVAVFVCTMWVTFSWIYGKLERILCDCFDIVRKVGVCGPVTIGRVSSKQYINVTIVDTPEKESDMSRVMRMVVLSCDGVLEPQGGELFSSQLVTPAQGFGNGRDLSHHGFGIGNPY